MKKRINLFHFLALAFAFFLSYSVQIQAQVEVIHVMKICGNDWSGGGPPGELPEGCRAGTFPATLTEDCKGIIYPGIFLTNLDEHPEHDTSYSFPHHMPPIYVRYQYSETTWKISGPYTEAKFIGNAAGPDGGQVLAYVIPLELEIAIDETECPEGHNDDLLDFERTIEIVHYAPNTQGRDIYPLYPIEFYADTGEVFACNHYHETWCHCDSLIPSVEDPNIMIPCPSPGYIAEPSYTLEICISCGECVDIPPGIELPVRSAEGQGEQLQLSTQITPNPFAETIQVQSTIANDGDIEYILYDARGQVVLRQQESVKAGNWLKNISTADITSGIYYFHLQQGEQKSVQKLIKF